MRKFFPLVVISFCLMIPALGTALAQDPAKVGPQIYKCTFENEYVRLCEVRFRPGDRIGVHSHPRHLLHITDSGKLRIVSLTNGRTDEAEFKKGDSVWSEPDTHSAVNIGATDLRALVIEIKPQPVMGPTESTIMQMERDWAQALMKADMAAFDRIVAPDWILVSPGGQKQTRAEAMDEIRSGVMKFVSMTPSDMDVRVFGDTAIVTGRSMDKGMYKGQDTSGEYRFTDVFVKRDGRWQAVSTHVTRVMPPM